MHFGWQTRLARSSEINRVFEQGKRLNCGVFLLITAERNKLESTQPPTRGCFVVSKRISKRAVDRNLLKRRFRALFRENYNDLPGGLDLVFIARRSMLSTNFEELQERFLKACAKLQQS